MSLWNRLLGGATKAPVEPAKPLPHRAYPNRAEPPSRPHLRPIPSAQIGGAASAAASADTGPWFIGKTVGGMFEIRGVLGRGGMGIVYLAYDKATQKKVAIKVPLGGFVEDEAARQRFAREAEAWTELIHPHIVHAFDVKDDQTTDYRPAIFMDYCEGGSLAARLERGRVPLAEALDIAIQIGWGMEFAHSKGKVHRDLKPGNVLLTQDGKALVSDFGLVKFVEVEAPGTKAGASAPGLAELAATLSLAGGTPEYMPPEQWAGKTGPESDLYAFGVMLYELCCGCRPFTSANRAALRRPHEAVPPPDPRRLNGELPERLSALMLACLAKDPKVRAARLRDFGAVAAELAQAYPEVTRRSYGQHRAKPTVKDLTQVQLEQRAGALLRLGTGCQLRGDLDEANRHYSRSREIYRQQDNAYGLQACIGAQAGILRAHGDWDRAMRLLKEQEWLCIQCGLADGRSVSLGHQALILQDRGDLDSAMRLLEEQKRICIERGNLDGLQASLGNHALILKARGDLDEAMKLLKEQERICAQVGNLDGLSISLCNQALILQDRKQLDEAMEIHERVEKICRQVGNSEGLAIALGNRALILKEAYGDLDGAMALHRQEEDICRKLKNLDGLQRTFGNQALILMARRDLDGAMSLLRRQEEICDKLQKKEGLARSLATHALLLSHIDERFDQAMNLFEKAREIAMAAGLAPLAEQIESYSKQARAHHK